MKRVNQSPYPEIIARNLRLLRAERGFSQEHVALEIEMHRSYLSGLEAGLHNPTVNLLARFEPVFGVTVLDLMREEFFPSVPWPLPTNEQLTLPLRIGRQRHLSTDRRAETSIVRILRSDDGGRPC
jgi:transcriptional regulator with XRE-family HTH domain